MIKLCAMGLHQLTKSKTEIKINVFCVGQKKNCFILKTNADKQTLKWFLQIKFIMDMVMCILAWTKDCGHWLGPDPRQGQGVRRDSPCPVMEPLSWPSGSLRAGRVSCALEPAPGPPPSETTRGHKEWFTTLPKTSFFNLLPLNTWTMKPQSLPVPVKSSWFSVGCWAHSCWAVPEWGWWSLHPRSCILGGPLSNCLSLRCRGRREVCFCAFYPQGMWALRMASAQSSLWHRSHLPPPPVGNHSWKRGWATLGKRGWRRD